MSDGALAPGTVLAGKFRVVSRIGEGGMGAVYEIEHELTKHRRALKLLHQSMAAVPSVVERFLREASAAGRVGNPHIVETFDAGVLESGEPYLVMEMLRGEPLSSLIARGPLPIPLIVDLLSQAAAGIQAAHEAGIVHRDLKPDNLFITQAADARPFVKILDFGISKFDPQKTGGLQLTQEGAALGTPYYMPPEQIRGEQSLDARADIYALGVILYECLAGVRPFEAETLTHLAILIHTGQPTPIANLRSDLPPGFADLVHTAMATDRARRISTAGELRAALLRQSAVGFSSQLQTSRVAPPSMAPARSLNPGQLMSTSAAGVSLRQVAPARSARRPAWVFGGVGLAVLTLGASTFFWSHSRSSGLQIASALPSPVHGSASTDARAPSALTAEPLAAPSATASAALSVSPFVPELAPPPITSARPASAAVSSSTRASAHPSGRADARGLAKDNPFK